NFLRIAYRLRVSTATSCSARFQRWKLDPLTLMQQVECPFAPARSDHRGPFERQECTVGHPWRLEQGHQRTRAGRARPSERPRRLVFLGSSCFLLSLMIWRYECLK